jgi:hypothetical protein
LWPGPVHTSSQPFWGLSEAAAAGPELHSTIRARQVNSAFVTVSRRITTTVADLGLPTNHGMVKFHALQT